MDFQRIKKKKEVIVYLKPKLLKILERTSLFLKVYRSGKFPKIIKVLPNLKNFEEIIWLIRPDIWSEQAIFSITRSFLPKLDKIQMSRFYTIVLVPRFQEIIFNKKSFSTHIQKTIGISSRFPSIFFPSFVLPICESKNCSIKEGAVICSIISKYHFPPTIVMTVLVKLLKIPITPPKCMICRIIISKNYLIPHRIIDLLVDFFISHNNKIFFPQYKTFFLVFLKNYFIFLSIEDKKKLLNVKDLRKKAIDS
jgi:essential nuclear protein 1